MMNKMGYNYFLDKEVEYYSGYDSSKDTKILEVCSKEERDMRRDIEREIVKKLNKDEVDYGYDTTYNTIGDYSIGTKCQDGIIVEIRKETRRLLNTDEYKDSLFVIVKNRDGEFQKIRVN